MTVNITKAKDPTAQESYLSQLVVAVDRNKAVKVLANLKSYTPFGVLFINDRILDGSDLKQLLAHELKLKKAK